MPQDEQPSTAGEFSGGASASATWDDFTESPPLPFPQRFPEFSHNFHHDERFAGMNNQGTLINNEGSYAGSDDPKSCFVASSMFSLFAALTMAFGLYGSETLSLGPNTSMLIEPNHLFVESIKVVDVSAAKGLMLYGFYKSPPLDAIITWPETHKTALPFSTHKEWVYYLNEGSQINISYSVTSLSSSSLVLVIAEGNTGLDEWLKDPSHPNPSFSWNIIHGNGSIQKHITESSIYYIGVGNLHRDVVKVHLDVRINALLYNTTEKYYKCIPAEGQCALQLFFLGGNAAVLTSPGLAHGMASGDWYVKLSYGPRWLTYFVCTGGMIFLLVLVNYFMNHFRRSEQDTPRNQCGDNGTESNPLLSQKDDNTISRGSSLPGHEEYAHGGPEQGGKPVTDDDSQHLCAICFEAPKNSFFIPCGHCTACFGCATRILKTSGACPICRGNTKEVRQIYTA
ncbi:hypothetical protein ACS0TY_015751 [Phlomoides rotata]